MTVRRRPAAASLQQLAQAAHQAAAAAARCVSRLDLPSARLLGLDTFAVDAARPPAGAAALALGEERVVGSARTISFNSVRYSTPPGYTGARV
jgi:hypothetical protein